MDLTTTYMGLELANPLVIGASPVVDGPDSIRKAQEAGAAAVVLHSLFEEEILREIEAFQEGEAQANFAEAGSLMPDLDYHLGPEPYLEMIRQVKEAATIPVIASLNGATAGGWTRYAAKIQEAGADALELNVYYLPTNPAETSEQVDERTLEIVRLVRTAVSIPVAVKLSPYCSALPNLARQLDEAGADGLVLFNRFYQPDIDIDELQTVPNLRLSTSEELRLRLRWLALLSGRIQASLAATGGVHTTVDVIKSLMAGAHAVQMVSALLIHGLDHITRTLDALRFWMSEHGYESVRQMRGSMSLVKNPNPAALTRANYVKVLESYRG